MICRYPIVVVVVMIVVVVMAPVIWHMWIYTGTSPPILFFLSFSFFFFLFSFFFVNCHVIDFCKLTCSIFRRRECQFLLRGDAGLHAGASAVDF